MTNTLWILTEERPKAEVLRIIFTKFLQDYNYTGFIDNLRILPILDNEKFCFKYEIIGFRCNKINRIYLKIVTGNSSFIDYLLFYQDTEPNCDDAPIYAIEVTKTDDKESRNTGVFQRCIKFVFAKFYFPNAKLIMLYDLQIEQKNQPTDTNIFGTKLLLTFGVDILGKKLDAEIFQPFHTIEEIILFKKNMRKAPETNVPILLTKRKNQIEVSGRLIKNNTLSHDPNIGALSIISAVLRKLGWNKKIIITQHGLKQQYIGKRNKFIQVANLLNISLESLNLPKIELDNKYWHYETEGEKLGTIFIHIVVESFTNGYSIFENHAGCEKGYFITKEGENLLLAKYKDRAKY